MLLEEVNNDLLVSVILHVWRGDWVIPGDNPGEQAGRKGKGESWGSEVLRLSGEMFV